MAHVSMGGEEGILTARVTGAGLVYTGACYIYWITLDPSAATGTTKWSITDALQKGMHINFSKPMKMETGIYAETVTNLTAATIGYATLLT